MSKVEVNESCAAELSHPWLAWTECLHASCEAPDRLKVKSQGTLKSLPLHDQEINILCMAGGGGGYTS